MGRAAIYARVSTDDRAVSLDAQEEGARAWAHREGHAITHVYRDDGVSGAEWVRRPALARLRLDAASTPRPWDVLAIRDLDRLGRDSIRLPVLLDDLARVGVAVVEWSSGRVVQLTGADLLVTQLRAGLAQLEREATAHRTRTALQQRAERGQVTGGCVYGYVNVRTSAGVHYEPHPDEAPIVAEIYARHAHGESARMIARSLTARGVAAPRGAPSWAPATVHAMLRSERYRGAATWGRIGAEYQGGERRAVRRADVITYAVPALVSPELWTAAQGRSTPARASSGRRSALSREPRYLLVGHATCGHCGGPLASWRTTHGSGPMSEGGRRVVQTYRCGWRATRGPEACAAAYMRPMEPLDRGVLASLAETITPARVREALDRARELLRPEALDAERTELELRARAAERSVARLTEAIAHGGGDVPELLTALRGARDELTRARAALDTHARPAVVDLATERAVVARAADVRAALMEALDLAHGGHAEAMQLLRALLGASLVRPLRAEWDGFEMTLASHVRPGALLAWREGAEANTGRVYDPNGN